MKERLNKKMLALNNLFKTPLNNPEKKDENIKHIPTNRDKSDFTLNEKLEKFPSSIEGSIIKENNNKLDLKKENFSTNDINKQNDNNFYTLPTFPNNSDFNTSEKKQLENFKYSPIIADNHIDNNNIHKKLNDNTHNPNILDLNPLHNFNDFLISEENKKKIYSEKNLDNKYNISNKLNISKDFENDKIKNSSEKNITNKDSITQAQAENSKNLQNFTSEENIYVPNTQLITEKNNLFLETTKPQIIIDDLNSNPTNYKNFLHNEISKISHDNFNDDQENYQSSDNETENFDIKRKKFNNYNTETNPLENNNLISPNFPNGKSFINIEDNEHEIIIPYQNKNLKDEAQILEDIQELNSVSNLNFQNQQNKNLEKLQNLNTKFKQNILINNTSVNNTISQSLSKEKKLKNNKKNPITNKDEFNPNIYNHSLEKNDLTLLKIPDENFLQKLEVGNREKIEESLKVIEEINKIEASLKLDQRLLHEKWQIRKNAYKEVSDLINFLNQEKPETENELEKQDAFETFFHWLKYFISDTNVIALIDGLNTFYVFITYCNNDQKNKALIQFFDELEKLLTHNKQIITDLCLKIILFAVNSKKFTNFTINEIIRKLNSTNNKLLMFINKLISDLIENPGCINEHYVKLIFEKSIFYYNSKNIMRNIERKKIYGKIVSSIFEIIQDDFETVKKNLNLNSEDTINLEKLLQKNIKEKKENFSGQDNNFTLYEQQYQVKDPKNSHNLNQNPSHLKSCENLGDKFNLIHLPNKQQNFSNNPKATIDASNLNSYPTNTEPVDLFTVLPDEFFEIPYITSLNIKREILEKINKKLGDVQAIKDREYKEILNIVTYTIDDTNILVNLEGIKLLKFICKLNKNSSNLPKLKNLLISCYDKFKDKKTNIKLELFDLFNLILINNIFPFEQFFIFKLQHVTNQKNPIVKQNILEYIKEVFTQAYKIKKFKNFTIITEHSDISGNYKSTTVKTEESINRNISRVKNLSTEIKGNLLNQAGNLIFISQNIDKITEETSEDGKGDDLIRNILYMNLNNKNILQFSKYLTDITKNDSQSQVKDLSVEILLIFKNIVYNENDTELIDKFERLICSLPNFRVNMINSGKTKNLGEIQNSEKEYKANLNRIKSNLTFSARNKSQVGGSRQETQTSVSIEKVPVNTVNMLKNKLKKIKNLEENNNVKVNQSQKNFMENSGEFNMNRSKLTKNKSNKKIIKKVEDSKINDEDNEDFSDDGQISPKNKNSNKDINERDNNTKSPNIKLIKKKVDLENIEGNNNRNVTNVKNSDKNKKDLKNDKSQQKFIPPSNTNPKNRDNKDQINNNLTKSTNKTINKIPHTKKLIPNQNGHKSETSDFLNNSNISLSKKTKSSAVIMHKKQPLINPQSKPSHQNYNLEQNTSNLTESNITNRNNKSVLEQRMDSAIEYISNLTAEQIFDYTKSVIRDFLIFIKKVTSNKLKEDLDCHFQVILKILDNILNQMTVLAKRIKCQDLNIFIPEEIFIQTFKVIIVAPCFLVDIDFQLLPFINKIRNILCNDNKFFEIYFEILNKFICIDSGSYFLQDVNPKNTFITFFDFFLYDEVGFLVDILIKFEPFILKNKFFSEEEKNKYIKEYRQLIKITNITHDKNESPEKIDEFLEYSQDEEKDLKNSLEKELKIKTKILKEKKSKISDEEHEKIKKNYENSNNENTKKYYDGISPDKQNFGSNLSYSEIQINEEVNDTVNSPNNFITKLNRDKSITQNIKSNQRTLDSEDGEEISEEKIQIHNQNTYKNNSTENKNEINSKPNNTDLIINNSNNPESKENSNKNNLISTNIDKDISRIKDSIKAQCRKFDMNIKRINNKFENEYNSTNISSNNILEKNHEVENNINNNPRNNNFNNHSTEKQYLDKLNEYKAKMNIVGNHQPQNQRDFSSNKNEENFYNKPKRNLEEIDDESSARENLFSGYNSNNINHTQMQNNMYNLSEREKNLGNKNFSAGKNRFNEIKKIYNTQNIEDGNISIVSNIKNNNFEESKNLILKIPTIILDDCVSEISHYVLLENSFMKMNIENKLDFTNFLSRTINNISLIKTSSFNCFLQLLEFLLTLLIFV